MTTISGATPQPQVAGDGGNIDTGIYDGQIAAKEAQLQNAEATLSDLERRLDDLKASGNGWCIFGGDNEWDLERQIADQKRNIAGISGELTGLKTAKGDLVGVADQARKDGVNLSSMLANGDIEGAIMMVQTRRTETLDKQIEVRIRELQERNNKIAGLNSQLAGLGKDDHAGKTRVKGQIDKLNADSQLDMIKMQSLTNKRNQAFETLTNLLQKFQKSLDAVVSNMR